MSKYTKSVYRILGLYFLFPLGLAYGNLTCENVLSSNQVIAYDSSLLSPQQAGLLFSREGLHATLVRYFTGDYYPNDSLRTFALLHLRTIPVELIDWTKSPENQVTQVLVTLVRNGSISSLAKDLMVHFSRTPLLRDNALQTFRLFTAIIMEFNSESNSRTEDTQSSEDLSLLYNDMNEAQPGLYSLFQRQQWMSSEKLESLLFLIGFNLTDRSPLDRSQGGKFTVEQLITTIHGEGRIAELARSLRGVVQRSMLSDGLKSQYLELLDRIEIRWATTQIQ